jgi:cell wall-associated NlpC family hydrolase
MEKLFKYFYILFLITFLSTTYNTTVFSQEKKFVDVNPDSLVNFAEKFIGTPYVWAGCEPGGFDCSGFVYYVYSHFGIITTKNSYDFPKFGVPVSMDSCKTGDLILFTHEKAKDKKIGHVGMVISKSGEPLTFIQASSSKKHNGVVITKYSSEYQNRFVEIIRLTL